MTDISFFNGNPNDADAWEREARAKEYKLEIQRGDGLWEIREGPLEEVYPYHLFETYIRQEAAGDRKYLCVTDVMRQDGNRSVKTGEHESTWKRGFDNRVRHIRLAVAKLTQRKPTGRNPPLGNPGLRLSERLRVPAMNLSCSLRPSLRSVRTQQQRGLQPDHEGCCPRAPDTVRNQGRF